MKKGGVAWLGLAAYIAAYDYWACKKGHETMSGAFGRALTHRWLRLPVLMVMGLIVKHLAAPKVLPKFDPLNHVAERWRGIPKTLDYNLPDNNRGYSGPSFPSVMPYG